MECNKKKMNLLKMQLIKLIKGINELILCLMKIFNLLNFYK